MNLQGDYVEKQLFNDEEIKLLKVNCLGLKNLHQLHVKNKNIGITSYIIATTRGKKKEKSVRHTCLTLSNNMF